VDLGCLSRLFIVSMCQERGGGSSSQPKTFPGILTIREGVANEHVIDAELKHLIKGKSRWTIKRIGEDEFIIH
jgi:hypothetical protein